MRTSMLAAVGNEQAMPLVRDSVLVDACLYLPLGVLLSVLLLELFLGGRKSPEVDKGNVVLLVFASMLFFVGAFLVFSRSDALGRETAVTASGAAVLLGVGCAVAAMLKQQCALQNLVVAARSRTRRKASAPPAALWPVFYLVVLLGVVIAGGRVAWLRPDRSASEGASPMAGEPLTNPRPAVGNTGLVEREAPPLERIVMRPDSGGPDPDDPAFMGGDEGLMKGMAEGAENMDAVEVALENREADEGTGTRSSDPVPVTVEEPLATDPSSVAVAESGEGRPEPELAVKGPTAAPAHKLDAAALRVFSGSVLPMLKDRCVSCHGPEKQKGGLRLDTPKWIRQGGHNGAVVLAFQPEKSGIYTSTVLPADDPDVMPAKGKPLTSAQTSAVRRWIVGGAPMGDGNDRKVADRALALIKRQSGGGAGAAAGATLEPSLAQALAEAHIDVKPRPDGLFEVDCSLTRNYPEVPLDLSLLQPMAQKIHTLDLSKTKVRDADLKPVAAMVNLRRLLLSRTGIGDEGMSPLSKLAKLEIINLYGTNVSDNGLESLMGLRSLKKVYLWNSKATAAGGDRLKEGNPTLEVNVGQ